MKNRMIDGIVIGGGPAGLRGPFSSGVLLFDLLLLLPPGQRVTRSLGIVLQRLLVQCIDVGLFQLPLGLGGLAVGFQLVAAVALFDLSDTVFSHALGGFLGFVRPLNAGIVFLHGMYLVMDENPGFLRGAG